MGFLGGGRAGFCLKITAGEGVREAVDGVELLGRSDLGGRARTASAVSSNGWLETWRRR